MAFTRRHHPNTTRTRSDTILGSNRKGHLFAASVGAIVVTGVGIVNRNTDLAMIGGGIIAWEWACTCDVDIAWKRKPKGLVWTLICCAWTPYSWVVPHRSEFSHSLLIGTPLRMLYVVAIASLFGLLFGQSLNEIIEAAILHWPLVLRLLGSAILADTIHLWKDDYSASELFMGK